MPNLRRARPRHRGHTHVSVTRLTSRRLYLRPHRAASEASTERPSDRLKGLASDQHGRSIPIASFRSVRRIPEPSLAWGRSGCRRNRARSQSRRIPAKSQSNIPSKRRASTTTDLAGMVYRARFSLTPPCIPLLRAVNGRDLWHPQQHSLQWFCHQARAQRSKTPSALLRRREF